MNDLRKGRKSGPNTKPIVWMLVLSWIIIGVGIWWVFFSGGEQPDDTVPLDDQQVDDIQRRYIGEKVIFDGVLEPVEGFGMYTHTFTNTQGKEFGAKSALVNLSDYNGNVQLKGEITDFKKDVPVINIEEIIQGSATDNQDDISIDPNPSYYYDLEQGIGVDLSISDGYEIETTADGELALIDKKSEGDDTVLTIAPFECKTGDSLQDCNALKQRFIDFGNDTFTNAQEVTFYNLTETNTWFAFNDDKFGYTFRSPSSDMITTFGALVNFIDEGILDTYVTDNKDICKNISSSMGTISQIAYQDRGNGVLAATMQGKNNVGSDATCKILIRVGSAFDSVLVGYSVDGDEQEVVEPQQVVIEAEPVVEDDDDIEQEVVEPEDENSDDDIVEQQEAIAPPTGSVQKPASFDGWLQYASVRGFTMWFSKQGVSYVGNVFETPQNLGIDGMQCWYKVNVIEWKRADDVATNPDLEVYECYGTTVTAAEAEDKGVQLVGASGENQYFAKYYTNNLDGMSIYVEQGASSANDEE